LRAGDVAASARHDFQGNHALQHLVERPEDDAEATLAEHLEHLVVPIRPSRWGGWPA